MQKTHFTTNCMCDQLSTFTFLLYGWWTQAIANNIYYFVAMFWFSPGDGGWGQWSNWTECTKSCGGGVRSRRRECDSPRPEGEGNYCEGLGTEVTACNTDHCPGMFTVWMSSVNELRVRVLTVLICVCVFSGAMLAGPRHGVQQLWPLLPSLLWRLGC